MNCDSEYCECDDSIEEHPCPYAEDVNNEPDSSCTCCAYCTQQCADGI